jgi:type II secretory pathway pseudopilin PulG
MVRARAGRDDGVTLIDVVVAMSLMSIFLAMFTTSILSVYRALNRSEARAASQSQLNIAFLRLDKEIRYAAGIAAPGLVGADQYVEYVQTSAGTAICVQLRLNRSTRQLQRRWWSQSATPTASAWLPIASNVDSGAADGPFTRLPADPTYGFQRLRVTLVARNGSGQTADVRSTDLTFAALNTSLNTSSDTVCAEGRTIP